MPRIAAASVEAHVSMQLARITAAARKLFSTRGYRQTDLAQIAAEVGLARNSLYRYFPGKQQILLACIQEDMAPYLRRLEALPHRYPDPARRILAWIHMQFDLATGPAHASLELMGEVKAAGRRLGQEVAELHTAPTRALEQALRALYGDHGEVALQASMLAAVVLAATGQAVRGPVERHDEIRAELVATAGRILDLDFEAMTLQVKQQAGGI